MTISAKFIPGKMTFEVNSIYRMMLSRYWYVANENNDGWSFGIFFNPEGTNIERAQEILKRIS